ncbi:MAG: hypothetical protein AB7O97_18470 [Planctomycetota bacterium]
MTSMQKVAALVAAGVLGVLGACAPHQMRAEVGAAFTQVRGELGLQNSGGNLNLNANMNDVKDQLGSGELDPSPYVRFEADWGPQRVKVSGLSHTSSGSSVLAGAFGDLPAGTSVFADLDYTNVSGSWSYDLAPTDMLRLAPGVQVGYHAIDVLVRSNSSTAFENVDTDIIVPMPYFDAEVDLGVVSVGVNAGLMVVDLRDADGRYWDAEAIVRAVPGQNVELLGGLRYMLFDAHGTATGRDFDSDIDVFGFFVGGGVKF